MTEREELLKRLERVKALAERGVGGEKENAEALLKRLMEKYDISDEDIVVRDIAERCRQTMITDGSCGMREFKSWVLSTMVTKDPYESALSTIISSASADPDNRAELISSCLETQYSRTI